MKFCWTTLMVKDMETSLAFYREVVGLPLSRRIPAGPGMEIAFLGGGETKVELIANAAKTEINIGPDISMGFLVASVDEKMDELNAKGIAIHSGPFQPNPHTRFFYVLDPDGVRIQFVEQSE